MHGLTCDSLVAARVVLADGRVVDRDHESEPGLFWALRGAGGGQFGVVTALTFVKSPEPTATRIEVRWPAAPVGSVVTAWQEWAPGAPDEVTANLTVSGGRRWSLVEQRGGAASPPTTHWGPTPPALQFFDAAGRSLLAGMVAGAALAAYRTARRLGHGLFEQARATDETWAIFSPGPRAWSPAH